MNTTVIEVELRDVYGKALIYPANAGAALLADLIGAKTFQPRHLRAARALGMQITEKFDRPIPGMD